MSDFAITDLDAFQVINDLKYAIDAHSQDTVVYFAELDPDDRESLIVTAEISGTAKRFRLTATAVAE